MEKKTRLEKDLNLLSTSENNTEVKEIEKATLLLSAPEESKQVLVDIGLDYQLNKSKDKVRLKEALDLFKDRFQSNTYTGDQIRKLCNVYDLKMLNAAEYKGQLDPELTSKLKVFTDNNYESFKVVPRRRDFFILSTRSSFEEDCKGESNVMFFYRESGDDRHDRSYAKTEDVFTLVHSWGSDLKPLRKARFLFYCPSQKDDGIFSSSITILSILMFIIAVWSGLSNNIVSATCIAFLAGIVLFVNSINEKKYDERWNQIEKK